MSATLTIVLYGGDRVRREALRATAMAVAGEHAVVVLSVERQADAEGDTSIDVSSHHAAQSLVDVLAAHRDFERVGLFGAIAGGLEVSAGAVVHGANVPFGGLGMATAQAALLTRAAEPMSDRGRVVWIALLSAAIKSLSPAGQRIRPMIAIAMQGWLYSRALRLLGWNLAAVAFGGFLMGAWACSQGVLLQWLLVGDALIVALKVLANEAAGFIGVNAPPLALLLIVWVAAHGLIVAVGTAMAWRRRFDAPPERIVAFGLMVPSGDRRWWQTLVHAFRELLRPTFWLPLVLILGALAWAGQPQQSLVFVALRAMTIALILMVLVQRLNLSALPERLQKLGYWGPALAWRQALVRLGLR